jgi:hypothetical protein
LALPEINIAMILLIVLVAIFLVTNWLFSHVLFFVPLEVGYFLDRGLEWVVLIVIIMALAWFFGE